MYLFGMFDLRKRVIVSLVSNLAWPILIAGILIIFIAMGAQLKWMQIE